MSENTYCEESPPRSQRVVLARRHVAGDGISLTLASEDVRSPTDWAFEETNHTVVVHLAGHLSRMESVFSTGLASDVVPTAGDIWAIPAGCRYSAMAQGGAVNFAEFSLAQLPGEACMPALIAHRDAFVHAAAVRANELAAREDDLAQMMLSSLLQTLNLHFRDVYLRHSAPPRERETARLLHFSPRQKQLIIERIAESMADSISVDELAQCVGLSVAHLMQGFKSTFGTTPWQYVLTARLDEAARLLGATGESVGQIATSTGFASPSHLATAFAKHFGVTPTGYRRERRSLLASVR